MLAEYLREKRALAWGSGTCISQHALWVWAGHLSSASLFFCPSALFVQAINIWQQKPVSPLVLEKPVNQVLALGSVLCLDTNKIKKKNKKSCLSAVKLIHKCKSCHFFLHLRHLIFSLNSPFYWNTKMWVHHLIYICHVIKWQTM